MDNTIVLYNLIEYIQSKDSHGKNKLLDFIMMEQIKQVKQQETERRLYLDSRKAEIMGVKSNEFR